MAAHRKLLVPLLVSTGLVLAGCGEDESGPLGEDVLPSQVVESGSDDAGVPTVSSCEAGNRAQENLTISAAPDDGYRYWTYDLEDGTFVGVSVIEPDYPFEDVPAALASVSDAIAECDDVEPLGGLPDGAVGFTSTTSDSNGERRGTTVLAPAGDDRIVTVAVSAESGSQPSVDALELLPDVEERAVDLDLGSS
jgi:hypothetical protein